MSESPAERPSTAFHAIRTLVLYSVAEFQGGHATTIRVTADRSGFSVGDDGRGHAIARSIEGAPYLPFIYTHLDYPFAGDAAPIQLQGLAMSLLNALCSELEVSVRKRNCTLNMRYRDGVLQRYEVADVASTDTGNTISGRIDARMAGGPLDVAAIVDWLRALQGAHPELKLWLNDQPVEPGSTKPSAGQ